MMPLDQVDAIDHHHGGRGSTNSYRVVTINEEGNNGSSHRARHPDIEPSDPKGPPTKQECTKLVYSLSRESAVYCCLSMGLGGLSDSYALRDEIRFMGSKVFDLVLLCKRRLMPLLLSKRLKEDEREELEKLYRIFAGCLEMLQTEFVRVITLQSIFPLWDSSTLLIQTGVSEGIFHRKMCSGQESQDASGSERKMADREEFLKLERINTPHSSIFQRLVKDQDRGEMCYSTSQLMDVKPWDYKPDSDLTKMEVETSDAEQEASDTVIEGVTRVDTGNPRHRKCIWIVVLVLITMVIIAGVLGLALALNKSENSKAKD